ncbi:hypothetical protein N7540_006014 [Penicillium herquei]|nr:hypothetical protein N7540_006014 [Penicillium herquei]
MDSTTMTMAPTSTMSGMMPTSTTGTPSMGGMGDMDMSCKISVSFLTHSWHIRSSGIFAGSCIGVILLVILLEGLRRLGREYDAFIFRRARIRHFYLTPSDNYANRKTKTLAQRSQKSLHRDTDIVPGTVEHVLTLATPPSEVSTQEQGSSVGTDANLLGEASRSTTQDAVGFGPYTPSFVEQIVRALLHTMQFAVAYFIMLLAMYYNGYIIICIFIGAYIGSFIFSWETLSLAKP